MNPMEEKQTPETLIKIGASGKMSVIYIFIMRRHNNKIINNTPVSRLKLNYPC